MLGWKWIGPGAVVVVVRVVVVKVVELQRYWQ
jgi:hypothetical protein